MSEIIKTARSPRRSKLTDIAIRRVAPEGPKIIVWDEASPLGLKVLSSGVKTFVVPYRYRGRLRWVTVGPAAGRNKIGLVKAREIARGVRADAAAGKDPQGDKMRARVEERAEARAEARATTFEQLAAEYVEKWSRKKNKSWMQADQLIRRYVLPRLGYRRIKSITDDDVGDLFDAISGEGHAVLANQVLAAVSAVFKWAVKKKRIGVNPARELERNKTVARERTLTPAELRAVWPAMTGAPAGDQLRMILLTAARPGEVRFMRWEHVVDDVWTMPGQPEPTTGWPGTKNAETHIVTLPDAAATILDDIGRREAGLVFEGTRRGRPARQADTRAIWADLGLKRFTPHDLRRTATTAMAELDIDLTLLSRILNHKVPGVTASTYNKHPYVAEKAAALATWATRVADVVEGRADSFKPPPST